MKRFFILFLITFLLIFNADGQTNGETLRGQVRDAADAVIVGATLTITDADGSEKTTQTDDSGAFVFQDLAAGKYTIRVQNQGFAVYENSEVEITPTANLPLEIRLNVESLETQVIVTDENKIDTAPDANASAVVLDERDIEALPDNEEDLADALQALAGPAAGPNGGEIFIDGFSGGSLPPRDTIREIRINSNPFSSEYDRLGFGRVEILTKPGTDKLRGKVKFDFEDESLNSRNPFVSNRAPFQSRELQAQIGGPLIKKRASYFVNFERRNTDNNALINALVLDPNLNIVPFRQIVLAPSDSFELNPRLDFQINESNTLVARYSFERGNRGNAGLGGFDLLSRAFDRRDNEHVVRLTETAVLNPKTINETRFQYIRRRNSQESGDISPTIRVNDAFTSGGANIGLAFSNEDQFEFQNYTSFIFAKHSLKVGARLRNRKLLDSSPGNFAGTFTFTSLDQYRNALAGIAIPTQFSIAGGDPTAGVSQFDAGLFAQDDWRVKPELTLSFGLRYENQTNISSNFNFAPRFGFAYSPGAGRQNSPKTVFRGGFGIFYDRFSENLTLQAQRFNGVNQQRFIVTDPAILRNVIFTPNGVSNVPTISQLAAFAQQQTTRQISPDLRTPYTAQFSFSVERQLPYKTTFSVNYINVQTRSLLRSRNVNAPFGGVRPFPNQGNILQYESTGKLSQNQLLFNLRTRVKKVSLYANYSLNYAKSDTDGAGTFPVNQYDLSGEYGRSSLDTRHRFVAGGNFDAPFKIRVAPFITFRSGTPFNITNGVDSNGDTLFTERPTFAGLASRCDERGLTDRICDFSHILDFTRIVPRNYGSGPNFFNVNMRLSKEFQFGPRNAVNNSGGNRGRNVNNNHGNSETSGRYRLQFSVQIRNILNRANLGNPVGNLRSSFFGQSISTAGGFGGGGSAVGNRRVELEAQFRF